MTRFTQQTKDVLSVALTLTVGLATGFFVDARSKHESYALAFSLLVLGAAAQVVSALLPSQDMEDLATYREHATSHYRLLNRMAEQAQKEAGAGNLSKALEWDRERAKIEARAKRK